MAYIILENARNSFITFDDETIYLTQRECAIVKPFCLPIFSADDLSIQFKVDSDITDFDLVGTIIEAITINDSEVVTDATVVIELISGTNYLVTISFIGSTLLDSIDVGVCFNVVVSFDVEDPRNRFVSTQCLQRIGDTCFTSKIIYSNVESAFDFIYGNGYENIIRLPIYFKNPVIQNEQKVYVRSNGTRQKLYAKLAKKWLGLVDMATEEVHQKLVVALSHDNITFTTDNNYVLECTFEDEYNPDFPPVMQGINVWTANFNVMETPFDEVNNNCG